MRTTSLPLLFGTSLVLGLALASGCSDSKPDSELLTGARTASQRDAETERQVEFVGEFHEALGKARRSGKPLLVFFSTENCVYCRQMLEEVFRDRQIVRLARKFICVRIEAGDAPQLVENFHVQAFPTVQFITPDGTPLHRVLGKKEPETLAIQMQAALQDPHSRTAYRDEAVAR